MMYKKVKKLVEVLLDKIAECRLLDDWPSWCQTRSSIFITAPMGIFNPLRKMSFNEEQKKLLNQKINKDNVSFRSGGIGQKLAYVEKAGTLYKKPTASLVLMVGHQKRKAGLVAEDPKCVSYIAKVRIAVEMLLEKVMVRSRSWAVLVTNMNQRLRKQNLMLEREH